MTSEATPSLPSRGALQPVLIGVLGGVLLLTAAVASPSAIEQRLLGGASGQLQWGPALFRGLLAFHGLALLAAAFAARGRRGSRAPRSPRTAETRTWVLLGLLSAVALALRLFKLDTGLWLDELLTFTDFARRPLAEIVTRFPNQNQHMLYSVLAHVSMNLFGEGPAGLRMPAVLFGVGSIPVLFLLGRRTNGAREAWLSVALVTLAYHHVWFSQNARGYSGLLMFTILSTWLFLRAMDGRSGWVAYALTVVLGLWTHMTMLFVVAAHVAVLAVELVAARLRDGGPRAGAPPFVAPLLSWVFAGTATAQLYALSLPEFLDSALHEVSLESEWTSLGWVVRETIARLGGSGVLGIAVVAALACVAAGWLDILRRDRPAALAMLLPGLFGGGLMIAMGHNLWPRFFYFCMGFAILSLARGVVLVPELVLSRMGGAGGARWGRNLGMAAMGAAILGAAVTLPRVYAYPKQDFAGARDWVLAERGPADATAAVGLAGTAFERYFAPDWPVPASVEELDTLRDSHATVWVVYTLSIQLEAWHPDIWESVQSDFEVAHVFPGTLGGGEVLVARSRSKDQGHQNEAAETP